jgi:hypothetical protein
MKPRLFRLLNAIHRFSVMINPPLDGRKLLAAYYNRVSRVFPRCPVRIGAELGATPLRCGSPSAPVKLTMAERLSLAGEQVPRGPVSTRGCPFEDL